VLREKAVIKRPKLTALVRNAWDAYNAYQNLVKRNVRLEK